MFVAIEGIDGSGKSTLAHALAERFGDHAILTREPYTPWANRIVRTSSDPIEVACVFVCDRAVHLREFFDQIMRPDILVITDRYLLSNIAYQSHFLATKMENPMRWLIQANGQFPEPDYTCLINVPVSVALQRIRARNPTANDPFEKRPALENIRVNYRIAAKQYTNPIVTYDGTRTVNDLVTTIADDIRTQLRLNY